MKRLISGGGGLLAVLLLWEAAALLIRRPVVAEPLAVMAALPEIFAGQIFWHILYSLGRIVGGVLLAIAVGYPLGVIMGYWRAPDKLLSPVVYLLYPVPKIALLPVVMLLAGVGEFSKLLMIFLIVVFQVVIAVRDSIGAIPREMFEPLISLGADFAAVFRHVIAPATLPAFVTALRIAMATAISVLFFTETYGTTYGIGFFIMDAWLRVSYVEMYAGILVLAAMGVALFAILDGLDRYVNRWQVK